MPYLTLHWITGDPEDLLARKQTQFAPVINRLAPVHGAIFSITAKTDDGLRVVNL